MSTLETLVRARALIADVANWTRGALGRDNNGEAVEGDDSAAVCFCAFGAIDAVCLTQEESERAGLALEKAAVDLYPEASRELTGDRSPVVYVNDGLGHDAALAVYDHAIATERAGVTS